MSADSSGSANSWAGWIAFAMSAVGFAMSRAYPYVLAQLDFLALDYFLAVAMTTSHLGFLVAAGVLVRPLVSSRPRSGTLTLPAAAAGLAVLTFVWLP